MSSDRSKREDHRMETGSRFARPKSLYIEATDVKPDGTEFVVKMRMEASSPSGSELTFDLNTLIVDDESNGLYLVKQPTGEYDLKIAFTRCRAVDA